jgi:hypothetical protein
MDLSFLDIRTWELLSYIVTVVALPFAIVVFWLEQKKERGNEQEELFVKLLDEYNELAKILIDNSDLCLLTGKKTKDNFTPEQEEKKFVIYDLLVSFFERAFILIYETNMNKLETRMWQTWEDYIDFWLKKEDFRKVVPELLSGEDPDFVDYMNKKLSKYSS